MSKRENTLMHVCQNRMTSHSSFPQSLQRRSKGGAYHQKPLSQSPQRILYTAWANKVKDTVNYKTCDSALCRLPAPSIPPQQ